MSKHILVVEDDDGVRGALQRWLISDGFRVTAVAEGMQVGEVLEAECIDLIVMDICLPDTDGLRLTTEIRARHASC